MRRSWALALILTVGCAADPATTPEESGATTTVPVDGVVTVDSAGAGEFTVPVTSGGPATTLDADAVVPTGFDRVAARATAADGTVCDLCLWLAESAEQRRRGLMSVTDLGPADGMAFRYPRPLATRFWMKDTLLPLSIAFFGPTGALIDSFDMEPCVTDECVRYPTPPDFVIAVETYQGGLPQIGVLPGSTLELLDLPCP
jgi:uncharacterized membrane protein (UPF0127 family)